jgi:transcriptional regulator of arginine metabolism
MRGNGSSPGGRADRQRVIRQLVAGMAIASQGDLAEQLGRHGFAVTQATVSRDIAELGLVKVNRGERHVYVAPEDVTVRSRPTDERLHRILADIPVTIGRSGLILLIIGTPGTASTIAQAIDDSSLTDQEGTLAGDNTLLVLFADETRLEHWLDRFRSIQALAVSIGAAGASPGSPIPTPSSEALA